MRSNNFMYAGLAAIVLYCAGCPDQTPTASNPSPEPEKKEGRRERTLQEKVQKLAGYIVNKESPDKVNYMENVDDGHSHGGAHHGHEKILGAIRSGNYTYAVIVDHNNGAPDLIEIYAIRGRKVDLSKLQAERHIRDDGADGVPETLYKLKASAYEFIVDNCLEVIEK